MAYCKKHAPKLNKYKKYCRHIVVYSQDKLWCDIKCDARAYGTPNHFIDGSPAKEYITCDCPKHQTRCPKFEPKKFWQWWLERTPKLKHLQVPATIRYKETPEEE